MSSTPRDSLVCTVSTVKDSWDNVERFVRRNLAAGADHMVVFVDDADADVVRRLRAVPQVTAVATDDGYWRGGRPDNLNHRQIVNANLVNVLLVPFPEFRWLFHLDGDECLDVDRGALDAPDGRRTLQLATWEAVARPRWDGPVTHYKRPPTREELHLLAALRVIPRPSLRWYFNGHTSGKPGLCPDLDLHLRIHRVETAEEQLVPLEQVEGMHVLHLESFSAEEFLRKWDAHLGSGTAWFRARKDLLRGAVAAVHGLEHLTDEERRELLLRVFELNVQDDFELLERLGLLATPDPARHAHTPRTLDEEVAGRLHTLCEALAAHPAKEPLAAATGVPERRRLLQEVAAALPDDEPGLRTRVAGALSGSRA